LAYRGPSFLGNATTAEIVSFEQSAAGVTGAHVMRHWPKTWADRSFTL
jgi:hypothetical protein